MIAAPTAARRVVAIGSVVVCAAILWLVFLEHAPYLWFRYDMDPGDGDVLNNAARIIRGLPIYGDWSRGELFGLYTPLYYYYLTLAHTIGVDGAVFARISNAVFLLLGFALAAGVVKWTTRSSSYSWLSVAVTMLVLFRRTWPTQYNGHSAPFLFAIVRPDSLCFFLELSACYLVCVHRERVRLVAVVAALCPFVKQPGLVVPGAFLLYYLMFDRQHLWRYATTLLVVAAALTIPLEMLNGGQFIASTFIKPATAIGAGSNWEYVRWLLGFFYVTWRSYLLAACGLLGLCLVVTRRLAVLPLALVFVVDALLFLKIGQNDGAGPSYLWLHWTHLAIFAGIAVGLMLDAAPAWVDASLVARNLRADLAASAALVLLAVMAWSLPIKDVVAQSRRDAAQWAELQRVGEKHEARLAEVSRRMSGRFGKWYTDRQAAALVRIGQILDFEAATLQHAVASGLVDRNALIEQFTSGKYHFVQRTRMTDIPLLESIFDTCYQVDSRSDMPDRGGVRRVEILEYVGAYKSCRFERN